MNGGIVMVHLKHCTKSIRYVVNLSKDSELKGKPLLDVGCGGGILSEVLAKLGAQVSVIDLAPQSIEIAKLHLYESNLSINYECIEVGAKAAQSPESFDVITHGNARACS